MKLSSLHKKRKKKDKEKNMFGWYGDLIKQTKNVVIPAQGMSFVSFLDGTHGHSGRPINYTKNKR